MGFSVSCTSIATTISKHPVCSILALHIFTTAPFDYRLGLHCSHSAGVLGGFDHSVRQRRLIRGHPEEYPVSLPGEW